MIFRIGASIAKPEKLERTGPEWTVGYQKGLTFQIEFDVFVLSFFDERMLDHANKCLVEEVNGRTEVQLVDVDRSGDKSS